jgi:hypothetical protein
LVALLPGYTLRQPLSFYWLVNYTGFVATNGINVYGAVIGRSATVRRWGSYTHVLYAGAAAAPTAITCGRGNGTTSEYNALSAVTTPEFYSCRAFALDFPAGVSGTTIYRGCPVAPGDPLPTADDPGWYDMGAMSGADGSGDTTYHLGADAGLRGVWAIELGTFGAGYGSTNMPPMFGACRLEAYG